MGDRGSALENLLPGSAYLSGERPYREKQLAEPAHMDEIGFTDGQNSD